MSAYCPIQQASRVAEWLFTLFLRPLSYSRLVGPVSNSFPLGHPRFQGVPLILAVGAAAVSLAGGVGSLACPCAGSPSSSRQSSLAAPAPPLLLGRQAVSDSARRDLWHAGVLSFTVFRPHRLWSGGPPLLYPRRRAGSSGLRAGVQAHPLSVLLLAQDLPVWVALSLLCWLATSPPSSHPPEFAENCHR